MKLRILEVLTPKRIIGNLGEREAAKLLKKKGYKILEKNYTALGSEIDIIARKKDVTAFVEVKTRDIKYLGYKEARPGSSVTPEKQRKIIKAANHYISKNKPETRLRLDVIEVYLETVETKKKVIDIKHIEGAFNLNSAYNAEYAYKRKKEGSNL